jgi:hypothetical protein
MLNSTLKSLIQRSGISLLVSGLAVTRHSTLPRAAMNYALFHPSVALVGVLGPLLAVQPLLRLADVRLVGRRALDTLQQPRCRISSYVRLHAEEPLVALLGLIHIGVAFVPAVLRRTRRGGSWRPSVCPRA